MFSHLVVTPLPIRPARFQPFPTHSDISARFFARGLFIALMMEAVRTSETSVYFNETTRRCIEEAVSVMLSAVRT
jgi:hypothetical protein